MTTENYKQNYQIKVDPLIVLFVIAGVIIFFLENKPSHFTGIRGSHVNYFKSLATGYSDFYGFYLKAKGPIGTKLAPYGSKIFEWSSILSVMTSVWVNSRIRKDDTWPHKATAFGITFGLSGFVIIPLIWGSLNSSIKTQETAILINSNIFFPLMMWGLFGLFVGGSVWIYQEIKGRNWVKDANGRLFPQIYSGKRGVLYKLEPREVRFQNEIVTTLARRRRIIAELLFMAAGFVGYVRYPGPYVSLTFVGFIIFVFFVLLGDLFREASYRLGAEFIKGAMVKDIETGQTNSDNIRKQKVHGFTNTSSENESRDDLKKGRS